MLGQPPASVRRLVASTPGLLTHGSAALSARLSALCAAFNVDPALAAALAGRVPGLLEVEPGELAARRAALAADLGLSQQQVG